MIDYFNANQASFWFMVGFALLAIEVLAFGFATGILLFSSIGALITGAVFWFGLVPEDWLSGIAVFTLASVVSAIVLWKPLKNLQSGNKLGDNQSSDLIGHEFRLEDTISLRAHGKIRYSGVEWRVELDDEADVDTLEKGHKVRVNRVNAGVFQVTPV